VERGGAGAAELYARPAHPLWRRPRACEGSGGAVDVSQTSRDLCRPGRALRQSLAAAEAARRKARHSRHHQPRRQVVVPGDAPAVTGLGRSRNSSARPT
jgi:hypothetical protein